MVLKYQSRKCLRNGQLPEPIFFEPCNLWPNGKAKLFMDKTIRHIEYYRSEMFRSRPFTDSWHLKYNPGKIKNIPTMPMASRYNAYSNLYVEIASEEETSEFLKLKANGAEIST